MMDRYTDVVSGLDRRLEELEDEMFEKNPRDGLLEEILSFAGNLKKLRRIFTYHQGLFSRLSSRQGNPPSAPAIDPRYFREINRLRVAH